MSLINIRRHRGLDDESRYQFEHRAVDRGEWQFVASLPARL